MEQKKLIIFTSMLLIFAFALWTIFIRSNKANSQKVNDFYRCSQNSDCISVKADNCGCTAGGKATSINKKYLSVWNLEHPSQACITVMSTDPSCIGKVARCVNSACRLVNK